MSFLYRSLSYVVSRVVLMIAAAAVIIMLPSTAHTQESIKRLSSDNELAEDCPTRARQLLYESVIESDCRRVKFRNTSVCRLSGAQPGTPEFEMVVALDVCRPGGKVLSAQNRSNRNARREQRRNKRKQRREASGERRADE